MTAVLNKLPQITKIPKWRNPEPCFGQYCDRGAPRLTRVLLAVVSARLIANAKVLQLVRVVFASRNSSQQTGAKHVQQIALSSVFASRSHRDQKETKQEPTNPCDPKGIPRLIRRINFKLVLNGTRMGGSTKPSPASKICIGWVSL